MMYSNAFSLAGRIYIKPVALSIAWGELGPAHSCTIFHEADNGALGERSQSSLKIKGFRSKIERIGKEIFNFAHSKKMHRANQAHAFGAPHEKSSS